MKITTTQLRQIIREEIQKMETKSLVKEAVSKGDIVFFNDYQNERGMPVWRGTHVGRVSKVIGSRNIEVTGVSEKIKGETLKVQSSDTMPFPQKGKKIRFKAEIDAGAGSGSQWFGDVEGVVISSDPVSGKFSIKPDDGKKMSLHVSNIRSMK
jgi:hypothetical protein